MCGWGRGIDLPPVPPFPGLQQAAPHPPGGGRAGRTLKGMAGVARPRSEAHQVANGWPAGVLRAATTQTASAAQRACSTDPAKRAGMVGAVKAIRLLVLDGSITTA